MAEVADDYHRDGRQDAACRGHRAGRVDSEQVLAAGAVLAANGRRANTFRDCYARRHNAPDEHATTEALASRSRPSSIHDGLGRQCAASPPAC